MDCKACFVFRTIQVQLSNRKTDAMQIINMNQADLARVEGFHFGRVYDDVDDIVYSLDVAPFVSPILWT